MPLDTPVIVLGGGLAGLSAAHTILQGGGRVTLIDKMMFMGGNSTKATSGINGAGTRVQAAMGIDDSKEAFEEDTLRGGTGRYTGPMPWMWPLAKVISHQAGEGVHWLIDEFKLDLDTVSRLGGHTFQRTHRKKAGGKFPGFMITYQLMQDFDKIAEREPNRARFIGKARATALIKNEADQVIGVEYTKNGKTVKEMGPVIIATGGFAAGGLEQNSLLSKVRPDLMHFPTTNGEHCTGDGIQLAMDAGGYGVGLDDVQIHPTGLINPALPDSRVLFLAAEALRGEGGIILDRDGNRFCNDLGTRNYVTGEMIKHNKAPYRLVLNHKAESGISWHCHHYKGRGVMTEYANGAELAKAMGIPAAQLAKSLETYSARGAAKKDPWGKRFFPAVPFVMDEKYFVGIITPVAHYTMGGVAMNTEAEVIRENGSVIDGLYVAGEACGGVHNLNRLGGSGLAEAVVFGRLAGKSALRYITEGPKSSGGSGAAVTISVPQANGNPITISIGAGGGVSGSAASAPSAPAPAQAAPAAAVEEAAAPAPAVAQGEYTLEEVAKHTTEDDCWIAVDGKVLNVTSFMGDHPGGKMAILTFAGKDASEMFNMVHEEGVVEKFAPECVIGTLKMSAKM